MQQKDGESPQAFVEHVFEHFMTKRSFAPHLDELLIDAERWGFMTWAACVAGATQDCEGKFGNQLEGESDRAFVRRTIRALVARGTGAPFVNHVEALLSDMEGYRGPRTKVITALRNAAKQRHLQANRRMKD